MFKQPNLQLAGRRHLAFIALVGLGLSQGAHAGDTWHNPTGEAWQALVVGHTVEHSGGNWAVYYGADGRKIVRAGGKVTQRKWWSGDGGQWCETMFRDAKEQCQATMDIQVNGQQVRKRNSYGGAQWTAKIKPGNPYNL